MTVEKISTRWSRFVDWYVWSHSCFFITIVLIFLAAFALPIAHDLQTTGRCTQVEEFLICLFAGAVPAIYFFWLMRRMGRSLSASLKSTLKKEP